MNETGQIIKQRLREEFGNSGLTTAEIARRVGVSPEMITQYTTTKNCQNRIRSLRCAKLSTYRRIIFWGSRSIEICPETPKDCPFSRQSFLSV